MEDNQTTPQTNSTFADVKLPDSNSATPITVGGTVSPVASDAGSNIPVSTTTNVPVQSDDSSPEPTGEQLANQPIPSNKGGGGHMIAIIIAVLVFLALAGAVVYVYMQSNSSKITRKSSTTTASNSVAPATAKDVDATAKIIDDNLANVDADKDFMTTDLSDATLGL